MKLTFLGAAREVAGSRFLLEACGKYIMVDYGMEQGVDLFENAPLPISERMRISTIPAICLCFTKTASAA